MLFRRIVLTVLLTGGALSARCETLALSVGGEVTELEITHCRTDTYEAGQLVVAAELTAVGSFRGRPAALFLSKASAAGGAEADDFDLYLMELPGELQVMPPLEARNKITSQRTALHSQRMAQIMADYTRQKMADLSQDEIMAKMDEQAARLDALDAEMSSPIPHARSFGVLTVDGSALLFESEDTRILDGESEAAFVGLGDEVRVAAQCDS